MCNHCIISFSCLEIELAEGHECRAMAGARRFLRRVHVPYVFMEWRQMFISMSKPNTPCPKQALVTLTSQLTSLGKKGQIVLWPCRTAILCPYGYTDTFLVLFNDISCFK